MRLNILKNMGKKSGLLVTALISAVVTNELFPPFTGITPAHFQYFVPTPETLVDGCPHGVRYKDCFNKMGSVIKPVNTLTAPSKDIDKPKSLADTSENIADILQEDLPDEHKITLDELRELAKNFPPQFVERIKQILLHQSSGDCAEAVSPSIQAIADLAKENVAAQFGLYLTTIDYVVNAQDQTDPKNVLQNIFWINKQLYHSINIDNEEITYAAAGILSAIKNNVNNIGPYNKYPWDKFDELALLNDHEEFKKFIGQFSESYLSYGSTDVQEFNDAVDLFNKAAAKQGVFVPGAGLAYATQIQLEEQGSVKAQESGIFSCNGPAI